jgi:hypothetical protein
MGGRMAMTSFCSKCVERIADSSKKGGTKMSLGGAPPPPDYKGAAQQDAQSSQGAINQQTQANRANVNTAFGSQSWNQGPDGQWTMNSNLNPNLQGAAGNLSQQFQQANSSPLNFGSLGQLGTGDSARDQAITGAYNQATSRLNPQWQQQGEQMNAQLANQGLDPNSQAARQAQNQFSQQKNDAYSSAMNNAIGQGTQAQQATFGENLSARQQGENEMMTQRQAPLTEMQGLQSFQNTPGYNTAGAANGTNMLGAAQDQGQYALEKNKQDNAAMNSAIGGLSSSAGSLAMFSDERMKQNIHRFPVDAIPGVPVAAFEYKQQPGVKHIGVIAQDLEKVAPQHVINRPDGLKMVDYSKLAPFSFK